ncbi:hypothetical protein IL306_008304 [Fusarium sp. DS 682]|nr:hypothetical protein IL306_008304 [Fusarium sp. DS 682]
MRSVMSMALDLLPGLEEQIREELDRVLNKQEGRPNVNTNQDQAPDPAYDEGGDGAEEAHDEDGDDVQEKLEQNDEDDDFQNMSEKDSEEDDDNESFVEFYAEESDDDTYQDPGEPARHYTGGILESIEPRTPIVTPRSMAQLRYYEQKYLKALRVAKAQKEAEISVLRSVDKKERELVTRKRTAADIDESPLEKLALATTPTPHSRKRQRLDEYQNSPASTAASSELPSLDELFSSSIARASSATTQPGETPAAPSSPIVRKLNSLNERRARTIKKSRDPEELKSTATATATTSKPGETAGASPSLFVTPDPMARQANTPFLFKQSASRHPISEERFREETAEFQAMTPSARETMIYTALREMRRRQGEK